jgi:hypothetical protein
MSTNGMTVLQQSNEILDKLRQVGRDQQVSNIEFFSDGSHHASKTVVGKLFKLGRTERGLRLYVRTVTGKVRKASWRMPQEVVSVILDFIYRNNYNGREFVGKRVA